MRDVNVTRSNVNAVAALRSCILEIVETTRKPGSPPNVEEIFDTVCGFLSEQVPIETDDQELAFLPMSKQSSKPRLVAYLTSGTSNCSERSTPAK